MPPKSTKTAKERAQIQREYRERRNADPERRAAYLQKEKAKYKMDIEKGKRKLIADMGEREQRKTRREWTKRQRASRASTRVLPVSMENLTPVTSPSTSSYTSSTGESRQRTQGRRIRRKEKAAAYRAIKRLEAELEKAKRKAERYKKRYQRSLKSSKTSTAGQQDTPRTKTRKLLANFHRQKHAVRKVLVFHYALVDQIRSRYQDSKLEREKMACVRLLTGKIVQKYKLQNVMNDQFGFSYKRWKKQNSEMCHQRRRLYASSCKLKEAVVNFYCRDDVSRNTPGKKDTKTVHKQKMQRRLLLDTLINTHLKFISEFTDMQCSYSLFCRLRPFWVVAPSDRDRDTCMCKVHDNLQLLVDKLQSLKVLPHVSIDKLCEAIVCDSKSKDCMYGTCKRCAGRKIEICVHSEDTDNKTLCDICVVNLRKFDTNQIVTYEKWISKVETHNDKQSTITVKEKETASLFDVVNRFNELLTGIKKHLFNIRHQYIQYRQLRSKLTTADCMIHIDFSENYMCRYHKEIQPVHFGGSHKQTTLHTGVLYVGQQEPKPFCTLSDSRLHDPIAIWAYLSPVFEQIRSDFPNVTRLHVFSDGPTTQYRQKKNFYLFSTKLFDYGFQSGTWNFFEASHGKGAADGVGAVLKRTGDRLLKQGTDLPTARDVFTQLINETAIKLYFVDSTTVDTAVAEFSSKSKDLVAVPGTMCLHQLIVDNITPRKLMHRDVSCFCSSDLSSHCACFNLKTFHFPQRQLMPVSNSIESSLGPANVTPTSSEQVVTNVVQSSAASPNNKHQGASGTTPGTDISDIGPYLEPIENFDSSLVGKFCVVKYDNKPYPGQIISVDEADVEVECMHFIGNRYDSNRFFWPEPIKDVCMYQYEHVVTLIPPPERLSDHGRASKHFRVDPCLWKQVEQLFV